jgi:predicted enzyme related to lactoylglutathione lyase
MSSPPRALSIPRLPDRPSGKGAHPDAVRNDIGVESIDDSLAAATANGDSIVVPKTDIGFGWYAAITDTEGNELGLYKSKSAG